MRRINSEFKTANMSEEGQKLSNRDYFGYVEMDDFACYVLADSLDEEPSINSAKLVVESIIRDFTESTIHEKRTDKTDGALGTRRASETEKGNASESFCCGGSHRLPEDALCLCRKQSLLSDP